MKQAMAHMQQLLALGCTHAQAVVDTAHAYAYTQHDVAAAWAATQI